MEVLKAIKDRCSTRKFKEDMVSSEELSCIIEAGRLAPTGMNDRENKIYVFRDKDAMKKLQDALVAAAARGNAEGIDEKKAKLMSMKGYSFCYSAPVFILTTYAGNPYNAYANGACLLENMMVQAAELEIGVCWINLARRAQNDAEVREVLKSFGVGENEIITGGLAVGYPAAPMKAKEPSEGNEVIYI